MAKRPKRLPRKKSKKLFTKTAKRVHPQEYGRWPHARRNPRLMVCYSPIKAFRSPKMTAAGKLSIAFTPTKGYADVPIDLACGQCIEVPPGEVKAVGGSMQS